MCAKAFSNIYLLFAFSNIYLLFARNSSVIPELLHDLREQRETKENQCWREHEATEKKDFKKLS